MLAYPASTAVAVAGYAGLSKSEIRGLLWEEYTGNTLRITQAVWHSQISTPKTAARQDDVPVIPALRQKLDVWRLQCGNPASGLIFSSSAGTPLELNNLLNRVILPVLNRCVVCQCSATEHKDKGHEFKRDESLPRWYGWHAFRRGLATILHDAGVDDLTIQRILRHSDVSVTRRSYIKRLPQQAHDAMAKIQKQIASNDRAASAEGTEPRLQ